MSWWDKDWVRGIVHTVAAVGTAGVSVPISAAYEAGRYEKRKSGSDSYGALTSASKADGSAADDSAKSGGVVYDGALADAETERRRKKSGTLTGSGDSTFDTSSLG